MDQILEERRGSLGILQVLRANTEMCIPLLDMANESLEALVVQVNSNSSTFHGAIFDTNDTTIGGNIMQGLQVGSLDLEKALLAIPQHSSPFLPDQRSDTYRVPQRDFSSPLLPYDQELDINRSYLSSLGQTRFELMRIFRQSITESVLDPSNEPAEFNKTLW